jgi:hypothetical protein
MANFHSLSTERKTVIYEFKTTCALTTTTGDTPHGSYFIDIHSPENPNLEFPEELRNTVKHTVNGANSEVYTIPQIWVYTGELYLPFLVSQFIQVNG